MPEDMLIEGEDSCVTSIEVAPDNVNGSDVYGTGLKNEVGEYNCFLNVIIQVLKISIYTDYRSFFLFSQTQFFDSSLNCSLYGI